MMGATMDEPRALAAFAQELRLRLGRAPVTAGPEGLASGVLAGAVGVSAASVSHHLKELSRAGLVGSRCGGAFEPLQRRGPGPVRADRLSDGRPLPGPAGGPFPRDGYAGRLSPDHRRRCPCLTRSTS